MKCILLRGRQSHIQLIFQLSVCHYLLTLCIVNRSSSIFNLTLNPFNVTEINCVKKNIIFLTSSLNIAFVYIKTKIFTIIFSVTKVGYHSANLPGIVLKQSHSIELGRHTCVCVCVCETKGVKNENYSDPDRVINHSLIYIEQKRARISKRSKCYEFS